MLPLTIKQLHSISEEDGVNKLDGVEVFSARIVGTIHSVEAHATNVVYRISDGTGILECKSFIEKEGLGAAKYADCVEQALVKVHGNIRIYEGNKSLMIYHMSVVTDWNELTHHLLESIHIHLRNTQGPPPVAGGAQAAMGNNQNMHNAMAMKQNVAAGSVFTKVEAGGNPVADLRDKILQTYKAVGDDDMGASFQQVMLHLSHQGANISMQQLKHEVDYLAAEGALYTTLDESHYRPTDGM